MPTIDNPGSRIQPTVSHRPQLGRSVLIDAIEKLTNDEVLDLQAHAVQGETVHLYVVRATAWLIAHGKVTL